MADAELRAIVHHLRRMSAPAGVGALNDAQLLHRFVQSRDEVAFEVLVWRHGGLVLGVCRNLLNNAQDAEDAFQATFFTLARKPPTVVKDASLAGWLYQVACRIARRIQAQTRRRRTREQTDADLTALASNSQHGTSAAIEQRELWGILVEELDRLPDSYRQPIISYYLEGETQEQAARELGRPLGSMSGLLARGCELLKVRLTRRGVTLTAEMITLALVKSARATLRPEVVVPAVTASLNFSMSAADSSRAAGLAKWALASMMLTKIKIPVAILLGLCALVAGTAGMARQAQTDPAGHRKAVAKPERPPLAAETPKGKLDLQGDPLPPGAMARMGTVRFRHSQNILKIAYAPDGQTLAAGDSDMACLWDVATGQELHRLPGNRYGEVAFAPDGKRLATADSRNLYIWELSTGKQLQRFPCHEEIRTIAYSPDGKALAWLSIGNALFLSDAATGKVLHQWPGPPMVVESSFAFSPDSRMLALACQKENEIPVFDTVTGEEIRRFIGHRESVYAVAFSPDGETAASCARDGTLRIWDTANGKELRQVKLSSVVWKLAFSANGKLIATGGTSVHLWESATGKLVQMCERDDDGNIESLAISPDGKSLAAARSNSHAISFWDVASGKKQPDDSGHLGRVASVAISPDGKLLASAAWEKNNTRRNSVHLWDPVTGKALGAVGTDLGFVGGLAFSPDGQLLAAGNEDGTIRLWDHATGREVRRLVGHDKMVQWIGSAGGGTPLVSLGYHDKTIRQWDVAAGKELNHFPAVAGPPYDAIAVSPDGKTIAQAGDRKAAIVLSDAATGKAARQFDGASVATALAISPDGRILASGTRQGICLWDMASGKELGKLADPSSWISLLAFSPDGRMLVCAGQEGIIRLWEITAGKERCRFEGHRGPVRCGAFSPDGRRFYSGSEDTTVLIWDVATRLADTKR